MISSSDNDYQRGQRLAEAGRHAEALDCIRQHLSRCPDDLEAMNDLGALLYALGRFDQAADQLRRVVDRQDACPPAAVVNFAEAALAAGRPQEAADVFDRLGRDDLLSVDLINRTATQFLNRGQVADATEALLRSLDMLPEQKGILDPIMSGVRRRRPNVAFFLDDGEDGRVREVYDLVSARFPVRPFYGLGEADEAALEGALRWCGIAWFEGLGPRVSVASRRRKTCRMVCRVHQEDVYGPWADCVDWSRFDALVLTCNDAGAACLRRQVPGLENKTQVLRLPRGVDLKRYRFRRRRRGRKLAWVGTVAEAGNPVLLLQCFARLHERDRRWRLFVAGVFEDPALETYLLEMVRRLGLTRAVRFEGWQRDLAAWLDDKHYIVYTGLVGGMPVRVLKGMACGLKPVVHTYPGAEGVFRPDALFATVEEFCQRVTEGPYDPRSYRAFVEGRFSLETELAEVRALLERLERDPFVPAEAPQGGSNA